MEFFIAEIIAKDEEGHEFPKKVNLRSNERHEWILDFGRPASYYLSDLIDLSRFPREKGLCLDGGGRNHRGSPVWVDLETFYNVIELSMMQILRCLKGNLK